MSNIAPGDTSRRRTLAAVVALAVVLAACGPAGSGDRAQLTVLGAASLGGVLADAARRWEAANPGVEVIVATDSSAALRTRIEQGARADLFLSADETNAARLAAAGLTDGPPVPFARNGLAIVTPRAEPAISTPFDLARPGLRLIAAGPEVPITRYADELVELLGARPDAPAGFVAAVARNVVSREDNVRAALAKIALGEGDAAIVYATDALAEDAVTTVPLPPGLDVAATYAGVVVAAAEHPLEARAFLDWLAVGGGRASLEAAGFRAAAP